MLSCRKLCAGCGVEVSVDFAGQVVFETVVDLVECASFGGTALDVGVGAGVHVHVGDDGHVEGAVEVLVSSAVDAVPDGVPGGRGDRADAGEAGESGLGSDAPQVRPRGQRDCGGDRPDSGLLEGVGGGCVGLGR